MHLFLKVCLRDFCASFIGFIAGGCSSAKQSQASDCWSTKDNSQIGMHWNNVGGLFSLMVAKDHQPNRWWQNSQPWQYFKTCRRCCECIATSSHFHMKTFCKVIQNMDVVDCLLRAESSSPEPRTTGLRWGRSCPPLRGWCRSAGEYWSCRSCSPRRLLLEAHNSCTTTDPVPPTPHHEPVAHHMRGKSPCQLIILSSHQSNEGCTDTGMMYWYRYQDCVFCMWFLHSGLELS